MMVGFRKLLARILRVTSNATPSGVLFLYRGELSQSEGFYLSYVNAWIVIDLVSFGAIGALGPFSLIGSILSIAILFRLLDIGFAYLRPLYGDQYPPMTHSRRILLIALNMSEAVLCFAALALRWGAAWSPTVVGPVQALYISVVTIATLGFGDVHPAAGPSGDPARWLTMLELACQVTFVTFGILILTRDGGSATLNAPRADHESRR